MGKMSQKVSDVCWWKKNRVVTQSNQKRHDLDYKIFPIQVLPYMHTLSTFVSDPLNELLEMMWEIRSTIGRGPFHCQRNLLCNLFALKTERDSKIQSSEVAQPSTMENSQYLFSYHRRFLLPPVLRKRKVAYSLQERDIVASIAINLTAHVPTHCNLRSELDSFDFRTFSLDDGDFWGGE